MWPPKPRPEYEEPKKRGREKGFKVSEETKAKMRISQRHRWSRYWGEHYTESWTKKKCISCGREFTPEPDESVGRFIRRQRCEICLSLRKGITQAPDTGLSSAIIGHTCGHGDEIFIFPDVTTHSWRTQNEFWIRHYEDKEELDKYSLFVQTTLIEINTNGRMGRMK